MFPVEIVYATIEVKTRLTAKTSMDALENIRSVKSLDFGKEGYAQLIEGNLVRQDSAPLGFIFSYNSDAKTVETFRNWFTPNSPAEIPFCPTMIGCLDIGLAGFELNRELGSFAAQPTTDMQLVAKLFPLVRFKDLNTEGSEEFVSVDTIEIFEDENCEHSVQVENAYYPVKEYRGKCCAIDQSRVLLNYLVLMTEALNIKKLNPQFRFSQSYLKVLDKFNLPF